MANFIDNMLFYKRKKYQIIGFFLLILLGIILYLTHDTLILLYLAAGHGLYLMADHYLLERLRKKV